MTDTANETLPKPSYEDINTPLIMLVGVISAILTLVVIMFVQGLYYHWEKSELEVRANEVGNMPAVVIINEQKELLNGGDGTLSIDDAMSQVIATHAKPSE